MSEITCTQQQSGYTDLRCRLSEAYNPVRMKKHLSFK